LTRWRVYSNIIVDQMVNYGEEMISMRNNLFLYRRLRGMKQFDLAKEIGIKEQTISSYERGRTDPSPEIAIKISEILKFSVDDVFPGYIKNQKE